MKISTDNTFLYLLIIHNSVIEVDNCLKKTNVWLIKQLTKTVSSLNKMINTEDIESFYLHSGIQFGIFINV